MPVNALESYRSTAPWSYFGNIVALAAEEMNVESSGFAYQNSELIYDLQGHRVQKDEKGVCIVNGRKIVIKWFPIPYII